MTIPVWPSGLPEYVKVDEYQRSFANGRLQTSTDSGPPKMRRKTSAAVKPISFSFKASINQVALFETFVNHTTNGGVTPFIMPDHLYHGVQLENENDLVLTNPEDGDVIVISAFAYCTFADYPTVTARSAEFNVSVNVNVLP